MKQSIYGIFTRLHQKKSVNKDVFLAASLPFTKKHKIGISSEGYPMFFIECTNKLHSSDINLEFISILFCRTCRLYESNSKQVDSTYTIISLKTGNGDFQQYFIEIVCIVLKQLPEDLSHEQFKKEIQKLIELFSRFNRPSRKTIQGLWAELFIIERSKDPEYLILSWHNSPNDKFDFNDGRDKIEVKSTSSVRRIHSFSLEQLSPNQNSNLLIASVFVIQTGQGKNIFDLKDSICKRVQNLQIQFRLNDILSQTIGGDLEKVFDIYFDYQQALDTLAFYNFNNIPTISNDNIPEEINNVRFDCDLSHIIPVRCDEFKLIESQLFKSIQI